MKRKIIRKTTQYLFLVFLLHLLINKSFATTYFSYQSGNWNGTNIWTTDSTGTTLVGSATPANNDNVYILTGKTITVSANIATTGNTITINSGAVLDLAGWTIPAITLNGQGLLRVSRVSSGVIVCPTITAGNFFSSYGGTVEYYATSGNFYIDDNRPTYCGLTINLGSVSQVITTRRNLTIYGNMYVKTGTFQINNTSTVKRTIYIDWDLNVGPDGKITVGTGNTNTSGYSIASFNLPPGGQFHTFYHELFIGGNILNNGTIRFTNLTAPNYGEFANNGAVTVRMTGTQDNTITCNGITDFYNLIIDKGIDQTYILTINSSSVNNFALYGSNSVGRNEASPFTPDNPEVRKALWIKNGTLKLTGNLLIPSITEGRINSSDGNGDYAVGSNSELWVAGPNVSLYSTASDATGFPQAPVSSQGVKNLPTDHQAISIYGKLRISDGYLSTRHSAGIIFWNTANSNSAVIVEGGIVNVSVMRTTITSSGKTSYLQTGGTVYIRGNETEPGEMSSYPIFSIPNPNSSFVMSGGDIIIQDINNGALPNGNGLYLACNPGNFQVTGGNITFELNPVNSPSFDVNITNNFWNVFVKRSGSTGNPVVNLLTPLVVSNNLTIYPNSTLSSGTGNNQVSVAANFTINSGGTYTPNNNLTSFTNTGNYFFWNYGTITNGLYDLQTDKPDGILILVSSSSSFTVRNDLTISSGTLADAGNAVYVSGNVVNNSIHSGAGKISLVKSTGPQIISGSGQGSFQNLELNNTTGTTGSMQVSLAANIRVTGNLILTNDRVFDIAGFQLEMTPLAVVLGTMSALRFIHTSGNPSDGGLLRTFADTMTFTYPIGTGTNYTPATIHVKKIPGNYGNIAIKPVPAKHPFATNTDCLAYYWKVEETGFSGVQPSSVTLTFNYGILPDHITYMPGKYSPAQWSYYNDVNLVDENVNLITFPTESSITGDYTAGIPDAFGAVTAYYSRTSGPWDTPSTWSNAGYGGIPASTIPGVNNPVFIGDGLTNNHTVTVTSGLAQCGSLSLINGSVLDVGTTSGNNFGFVLPSSYGTLRISSTNPTSGFPAGDFGNFLGSNGGITEYYSNAIDFTLPTVTDAPTSRPITTYCQLKLTPSTGYSISMPNSPLSVYSNMTVQGVSATALAKFNGAAVQSLHLLSSLLVNGGNLLFQNSYAQDVRIEYNVNIASGAIFSVANSGVPVNNTLSIGGSITNNGMLALSASNTLKCDVTFTGNADALIAGRGTTTDFYSITVNKGYTQTPVLNVTSSAFSFSNNNNPLTLVNGTFRITSNVSDTISTSLFTIPATTCLSANGGTIYVASAAADAADVALVGKLEVRAGSIIVGNSANNINNDVEYAGAGFPTIEVRGGSLFINGQVRRSLINGLGSLTYSQSGSSTVTVNGRHAQATRGRLEVLNTGSVFNMTGGTLTIVRGAGSINYDLYIHPEIGIVTGGTIIFGNSTTENTNSVNIFDLYTTIPLNNLTVDGTTYSKTVNLMVYDLTLLGNLVINATSVFNTDSLDITINGNLTNLNTDAATGLNTGGYRPRSLKQTTIFNSSKGNQTLTGASGNNTNFANLVINNLYNGNVTLQANTAITVNNNLVLTRGTLADGGNVITVLDTIFNSSVHSGSGRITLSGSIQQVLTGNGAGKFGNLYLNSTNNVKMISPMEITGVLTFRTKMLEIGANLLKLSNTSAAAISGSSSTSYIKTDGLVSDAGVMKAYPTGTCDFTFPIGITGKYTPARENVTANTTAGTIIVVPVNSKHPCTTDPANTQLNYYWHVTKTGFTTLTVSQYYTYVVTDVMGTEASYVAARYYSGAWSQTGGSMYIASHQIRFLTASFIEGDYTAGYSSEFGVVPTYYSRDATCMSPMVGNWDVLATWSTSSPSGPAASSYPNGQPVVISSNHIVSTNGTSRQSSTMTLNGTALLDLLNTVGHNFGVVTGTGTIKLNPTAAGFFVFPAGNFSAFTSPGGGTVELNNTSGTGVFPYLLAYNNLSLTGSGSKLAIDADITVNGSLTNNATSSLLASTSKKLILMGNWVNDGNFIHNNGTIEFNGNTVISGVSPPTLNNLIIDAGKSMTAPASATLGIAGNWINSGTFNHNSGTVRFTGTSTISGSSDLTLNNLIINSGSILTGRYNDNLTVIGNWLNDGTYYHNDGMITFSGNTSVSGASVTGFGYVYISNSAILTGPPYDTIAIAYDLANDGTFNSTWGTVEFNGVIQNLGGSNPINFENFIVATGSNTSINTDGQTIRGVLLCNGILNANSYLTLLSDSTQTALIDGSGTGDVLGYLTMQRYLQSGFGYKYVSSPFQTSFVGDLSPWVDLNFWFPTFYGYDENHYFTGWYKYIDPAGTMIPMQGYAANFGAGTDPETIYLMGEVNNKTMPPATLFNSNRTYTKGFNLMGNPYPSPIDWDSQVGWVRINIDNALYYWNAGGADQWTGTYSSYVNGISSDGKANNIIGSMQGFFLHVSNGQYPVAGTYIITNDARVNNLNSLFHKKNSNETRPWFRFSAKLADWGVTDDPVAIYLDPEATPEFDKERDALKLMNTDVTVPNLYALSSDNFNLSIDAIRKSDNSVTKVPLALKTEHDSWVLFRARDLRNMPPDQYIYFVDTLTGIYQNLFLHPDCRIYLKAGVYEHRFSIVFSPNDLRYKPGLDEIFHVYASRSRLFLYQNIASGEQAEIRLYNMVGQEVFRTGTSGNGYHEIDVNVSTGIYIVSLSAPEGRLTKKVFFNNQ